MQVHVAKIPAMAELLERLDEKTDTVVLAVRATNADLADLDGRVARLEQADVATRVAPTAPGVSLRSFEPPCHLPPRSA